MLELAEGRVDAALVPGRRRVHRSRAVLMMARFEAELGDDLCLVCDISPMGARLKSTQEVAIGDTVRLDFGDALEIAGTVRWIDAGHCGLEFEHVVDLAPLFERTRPAARDRQTFNHKAPGQGRRSHPRLRRCAHLVVSHGGASTDAELFDISPVGARIELSDPQQFALGERLAFAMGDRFECDGVVRWIGRSAVGVAFDPPLRMWKLEKWLLDGMSQCDDCAVEDCSAPSFRRALAGRKAERTSASGAVEFGREGK